MTQSRADHLASAGELLAARPPKLTFLHVTRSGAPADTPPVRIAGAHAVHLDRDLAGPGGGPRGRLPLPAADQLTDRLRRWGIDPDNHVVVYAPHAQLTTSATRAWFVLRWAGLTTVRVLDGGLDAWLAADGRTEAAHPARPAAEPAGSAVAVGGALPTIDADEAAELGDRGLLLDARARASYAGEPDDPRSGHIPGALPVAESVFADGRLRAEPDLRKLLIDELPAGENPGVYCGGGVSVTAVAFAYATLGRTVPVYVASWSGWSADPARPVARGDSSR